MTELVVVARDELERIVEEAAARAVRRALRPAQTEREQVDLIGMSEIAEMLGVSKVTAYSAAPHTPAAVTRRASARRFGRDSCSVSYTHLTLPTKA